MTDLGAKAEKMRRVTRAAAEILFSRGPAGLTMARLARSSKVSRAWIYKYIAGKGGADALLEFTVNSIGAEFGELDIPESSRTSAELIESVRQGTWRMLDRAVESPWYVPLYFRYGASDGKIGRKLRRVEQLYYEKLAREFMKASDRRLTRARALFLAEMLTHMRFGLAFGHVRSRKERTAPGREEMDEFIRTVLKSFL